MNRRERAKRSNGAKPLESLAFPKPFVCRGTVYESVRHASGLAPNAGARESIHAIDSNGLAGLTCMGILP